MLQATAPIHLDDHETRVRRAASGLNQLAHAGTARVTAGLSPVALSLAYTDWLLNWAGSPGTHAWLLGSLQRQWLDASRRLFGPSVQADADRAQPLDDPRFSAPAWQQWPYRAWADGFQSWTRWCSDAARLPGMTPHHADVVGFYTRQWLDMLSPSNLPLSPEVAQATWRSAGQNWLRGTHNLLDDWRRQHGLAPLQADAEAQAHRPGHEVAVTPGAVVYRNELVELIQYEPATPTVHAEPVFIVPSWIMKYYILDLSPQNSMVKYLVEQGHTVFILSWRNPDEGDAHLSMDDYLHLGVFDPLAAIAHLLPGVAVHAAGYCLGGTLLAIAAAALARPGRIHDADQLPELKTVSLLAAQVDFTEPGEIGVMIDPAQVKWLEDLMAERGYLSGRQMAGSFQFLHSRELVWSRWVREYLLGEREHPSDLMAWNADVTRMPATMHSEYLNSLFIRNDLAEGRYLVEGQPVSLGDLRMPLFAVGTEKDHVSPWPSVHKLHRLVDTELTFLLTSGGHNAGILSEPGHPHRSYRCHTRSAGDPQLAARDWLAAAERHEGSWWPQWQAWLAAHSSERVKARRIEAQDVLCPAPGDYVMVRYED